MIYIYIYTQHSFLSVITLALLEMSALRNEHGDTGIRGVTVGEISWRNGDKLENELKYGEIMRTK